MLDIDPETLVINGQIRHIIPRYKLPANYKLELKSVWTIHIHPSNTPKLLNFIKENCFQDDEDKFKHLKRFKKLQKDKLSVILTFQSSLLKESLINILKENLKFDNYELFRSEIPINPPLSQSKAIELSENYWPVVWKGNSNIQLLKQEGFNFEEINKNLREISKLSQNTNNKLPIITRIYDPINKKILITCEDGRFENFLNHSCIIAIDSIAKQEIKNRKNNQADDSKYLCTNYDVYTTHEPCTYCCMALIHSRINRLFYINSSKKTGSIEVYNLNGNPNLNWRFNGFKWCGDDLKIPVIDNDIFI